MNNEQFVTPTGAILTPIRRVKSRKWLFNCTLCSKDSELWPEMIFDITAVRNGARPCGCSKKTNWKPWQWDIRIKRKASEYGCEFLGYEGEFSRAKSKAVLSCPKHGEFKKEVASLMAGQGCIRCGNERIGRKLRTPKETNIKRIESACKDKNIEFLGLCGEYTGKESRVNMICNDCNHRWTPRIHDVVTIKSGCPSCCGHGYDVSKDGYLYLLISDCGSYMKIGITNNPINRIKTLRLKTPFSFNLKFCIDMSGHLARQYEKEIIRKYSSAEMSGFSGATEWLIFDKSLLLEEDYFAR